MAGKWGRAAAAVGVCVAVSVSGCSCDDDALISMVMDEDGTPPAAALEPEPPLPPIDPEERPIPEPVAPLPAPGFAGEPAESRLMVFARGGLACAGAELPLSAQALGGTPPLSYSWSPAAGLSDPTSQRPVAIGGAAETYTVTVTDASGATATATATADRSGTPTPVISFATGAASSCAGEPVELDASGSRDALGAPVAGISWDLDGDGATDAAGPVTGAFTPAAGQRVTVTVTDTAGCSATSGLELAVRALPTPAAVFVQGAARVCAGSLVALDGSASRDADGNPVAAYSWNLDGDPSTVEGTAAGTGSFAPPGAPVSLRVTDAQGCSAALAQPVELGALPSATLAFLEGSAGLCSGAALGLDASASRDAWGNPVASYAWDLDGDPSTVEATGAAPASFVPGGDVTVSVRVVDSTGCAAVASAAIVPRQLPTVALDFAAGQQGGCAGEPVELDASASVDADGAPVATYSWDLDGDGDRDAFASTTGAFVPADGQRLTVRVADAQGCSSAIGMALAVRPLPTATLAFLEGAGRICDGSPVNLDASASRDADGAPVAGYAWDLDGVPGTVEGGAATTGLFAPRGAPASVTVTDAAGCSATALQPIEVGPLPVAAISFAQGSAGLCAGDQLGLDASASRDAWGNPVATVAWDLDGVAATVESVSSALAPFVPAGPFTAALRVTDAFGCSAGSAMAISPRALPTAALTFAEGRAGACDGDAVRLSAASSVDADGAPVAAYAWDLDGNGAADGAGSLSARFTPIAGQQPSVIVTDASGCSSSASLTLSVRPLPTPSLAFLAGGSRICDGAAVNLDASASRDADGAPVAGYAWDLDGVAGTVERATPTTGAFAPGAAPVTVTVTDVAGCTAAVSQPIVTGALPVARISFGQGSAGLCAGNQLGLDASASRDAAGNPVATVAWDLDGNPATVEGTATALAPFVPAGPMTAALRVADSFGCSASTAVTISPRALPTAALTFAEGRAGDCIGDAAMLSAASSVDADGAPAASYAWDLDGNGVVDGAGATSARFTPVAGQRPTVRVTDASGCSSSTSLTLSVRALPTPSLAFLAGGSRICDGAAVNLDASGSRDADGAPVASYAWDLDGVPGTVERATSSTGAFAPGAAPVSLTVTDVAGCTAAVTQPIVTGALPVARISFVQGSAGLCAGATLALDASASRDASGNPVATVAWDLDGNPVTVEGTAPALSPFVPAGPMTAALRVADAFGCSASTAVAISPRALPTAALTFAEGRAGGCAGDPAVLSAASSVDADGAPVASYAWDLDGNGVVDGSGASSARFTPVTGQRPSVRVTDAAGCSSSTRLTLSVRPLPTPSIAFLQGSAAICAGGAVQLGGAGSRDADGSPVASYAWDVNGDGVSDYSSATTPQLVPSSTGAATLTVADAQGCTATGRTDLRVLPLPAAQLAFVSGAASSCQGTALQLSATPVAVPGGAPISRYAWDLNGDGVTDSTTASTGLFTPAASGTARVTFTDSAGCSASGTLPFTVRPLPYVTAGADRTVCTGSAATLGGDASTDLSYAWTPVTGLSDPAASTTTVVASAGGVYTVTATDPTGCSASDSVLVNALSLPTANAGPDREVALGGSTSLSGSAAGGSGGHTFSWTPAALLDRPTAASPQASPPANTTFDLTVTDAAGCTGRDSALVSVVGSLTVYAGPDYRFCTPGEILAATPVVSGGVPPLSYAWTASPACAGCISSPTTAATSLTLLVNTVFTLTVTDANGTTVQDSLAITRQGSMAADAGPDRRIERGDVTQVGTAGQPGLTYSWSCNVTSCGIADPSDADPFVAPLYTTAYTVTISNGASCGTDTVLVTVPTNVLATVPLEGYSPWPRDAMIWVIFDGDIDPLSLAGNVFLRDPVDGSQLPIATSYDAASRTLTVDPTADAYRNNNPYYLELKGGPGGISSGGAFPTPLFNDFVLEFNASSNGDGVAPRSDYLGPAFGASGVPTDTDVVVRFDEPVDPRSVNATTLSITGVPGTVTYDPRSLTANLQPAFRLTANTLYTVRVNGVRDGAGNSANWSWSFTTGASPDSNPPTVIASSPTNGRLNADLVAPITVTWSEPIDPATLDGVRLLDVSTGYPLAGDLAYDEAARLLTFTPRVYLEPVGSYRLDITGVRDHAGNLAAPFSTAFITVREAFYDGFQAGVATWTLQAPWAPDFQAAHEATLGLSDSPGGLYGSSRTRTAVSPPINVSGLSSVKLSFYARRTLAVGNDLAYVESSTDGVSWTTAATLREPTGWRLATYTLNTGGRATLWVRFRLVSDASVQLDGWFIDEVVVR